jgi:hypothetical protein
MLSSTTMNSGTNFSLIRRKERTDVRWGITCSPWTFDRCRISAKCLDLRWDLELPKDRSFDLSMSLPSPRQGRTDTRGRIDENRDLNAIIEKDQSFRECESRAKTPSRRSSINDDKNIGDSDRPLEENTSDLVKKRTEGDKEKIENRPASRRHTIRVLSGFWVAFMVGWSEGGEHHVGFVSHLHSRYFVQWIRIDI